MNSDEQQNIEQKLFDEFLKESRIDDAVCENHRSKLRVQVLNAFDRSQLDAKVCVPDEQATDLVSRKTLAAGECVTNIGKTPAASALRLTVATRSTACDEVPRDAENRKASQVIGVVASIAACLLAVVSLFLVSDGNSSHRSVSAVRPANAIDDPVFVAALAEVQALHVAGPPEMFFHALEICQKEHEARQANAEANRMRLLYESLLRSFPVDSSKG